MKIKNVCLSREDIVAEYSRRVSMKDKSGCSTGIKFCLAITYNIHVMSWFFDMTFFLSLLSFFLGNNDVICDQELASSVIASLP